MFSTNENIIHVSSKLKLPYWWVESIAIEYLNCREFAAYDEIWTFNFDLISRQELIEAVQTEKIVVSSPIIQYPPIGEGLLKSLKNYFLGQDYIAEQGSIIEGPVSRNDFPDEVEFLDFLDPMLSFFDYFQVYDDGKFWQWKIAESTHIKGESYSKWFSSEMDLTPINEMEVKLGKLRDDIVNPGEQGHAEFKLEVEGYYRDLKSIRMGIFSNLWKIHLENKNYWIRRQK
ncbi:MAG: hypothetical protein FGO69_09270 [Methanobacterium sp.]|jgi:hypothetical protein|nr:MAG: hypothetical protein FGO69_09270 [Methanobacterium sp.]